MTKQEFSDSFDTLINSYSASLDYFKNGDGPDINLTEYEKSWFLTEAQEQLVLSYYNGKNSSGDYFEKTEEIRRYLSNLVKTAEQTPVSDYSGVLLDSNSAVFSLPNNLWFITYEAVKLGDDEDECLSGKEIAVVPVTQDEFHRTRENPFKGPNYRRALRLDISDNKVEIVSNYKQKINKYIVRYVEKLNPIVLGNLDGLTIDSSSGTSSGNCTLHEALHKPILELAVRLALQSKGFKLDNQK